MAKLWLFWLLVYKCCPAWQLVVGYLQMIACNYCVRRRQIMSVIITRGSAIAKRPTQCAVSRPTYCKQIQFEKACNSWMTFKDAQGHWNCCYSAAIITGADTMACYKPAYIHWAENNRLPSIFKERFNRWGPRTPHGKGKVAGRMEWRDVAYWRRGLFLNYF